MALPSLSVSVVIPVQDDPRLAACVASVMRVARPCAAEVIVVDHRSSAGFASTLAALPEGVRVLHYDGPTVYGARNLGIAAATGGVLMFTDADCIVRPGWIDEALAHIRGGAGLVQGFSGSVGRTRADGMVQARYAAHLRHLAPGDATECDTRNLAVARHVFAHAGFAPEWRRSADTRFGLLAERAGFRVEYCPAMRVDHAHDTDLRRFAAKQVCHGWGAQRVMREDPGVRWHGGHLRLVARVCHWLPLRQSHGAFVPRAMARSAILAAGALQRSARLAPVAAGAGGLLAVDKLAALAGHLLYESGRPEPSVSELLGLPAGAARD